MSCCGKKRIRTGNKKLDSILEGWKNIIWRDSEVERIAKKRAAICSTCDRNIKDWCIECACYIPAKARSMNEYCKLDKWDE